MEKQILIVNELLAFLQQKLDVMDEVSAIQICKSGFSEVEIAAAKKLLYESLGKSDQMVSRRRDGTPKSLQDIITLFKETDPDDVPTFVARDLHKLPPVTFDHVDVTCLLKDIVSLKASLAEVLSKLEASQDSVAELRKEVATLRGSLTESRSFANNANSESAVLTPPAPSRAVTSAERSEQAPRDTCLEPSARTPPAPPASPAAPPAAPPASAKEDATVAAYATAVKRAPTRRRPVSFDTPSTRKTELTSTVERVDDDGFVTVQNKKRTRPNNNKCGTAPTGPNFLLRAAVPTTLLYVSRLHYSTSAADLVEYVKVKTKYALRVTPLESRHSVNFKSFVVRVPTEQLESFTREDFWPKGVVFRRFRGSLQNTTTGTQLNK